MSSNKKDKDLRKRAEEILLKRDKLQVLPDKKIHQIIKELNLHQIELEIQNEHLIKMQHELQISQNKYANLYNLAPVAYITLNRDGLIVDVNQAGLVLFGMKKESLINRCFSLYIAAEFQMYFAQFRKRVMSDKLPHSCEIKLVKWSGPLFDAILECGVIEDSDEKCSQFLMCITDITNHKQAEQAKQMQRIKISAIDKMRSVNEQIYIVTRNHNHSLTVISNYISGCIRRLESDSFSSEELIEILKKISEQSSGLSNLIFQMMNLTSKSVLRYEFTDIDTIITDALSLIDFELANFSATVQYDAIDKLPSVKVDKLHILQVILSLAHNSIEAMSDAKTIQPKLLIETKLITEHEISISLFDNGPGFEPVIANKIFEPNFSTKSYAMGLGLATSRTIIEKHGGQLTAQLNPSGGASFQFTLPCVSQKPQ